MSLDPEVSDAFKALIVSNGTNGSALTQMVDRNLTQGLGVVNTTLIQQHGGVSDDSAQFAAMQAAAGVPRQGAILEK